MIKILSITALLTCFYSCGQKKSNISSLKNEIPKEVIWSFDSTICIKSFSTDTVKVYLNNLEIHKFNYKSPESNTFTNKGIINVINSDSFEEMDILFLDSTIFIPLNDVNGRTLIYTYDLKYKKSISIGERFDRELNSLQKIYIYKDMFFEIQSNNVSKRPINIYKLKNNNLKFIKQVSFQIEDVANDINTIKKCLLEI